MRISVLAALVVVLTGTAHAAQLSVEVQGDRAPLIDAVVLVTPLDGQDVPEIASMVKGGTAVVDQVDKEFVPELSIVRPDTSISFPNYDNIHHHVYSFSPAKTFELPLFKGADTEPVVFDREGVVTLGCNIHDWMVAYIITTSAPVVLRTRDDGNTSAELPAGSYRVTVWHPRIRAENPRDQEVTLSETGARVELAFELQPEIRLRRPAEPLRDY